VRPCPVHREVEQALGLQRVGLEERIGGDAETQIAELLFDLGAPVQELFGLAHRDGCAPRVDVAHQARETELLAERRGDRIAIRERAGVGHQVDHRLAGALALAHDEIAPETGVAARMVCRQAGARCQLAHARDDGVRCLGHQMARREIEDPIEGAGRVQAEHDLAVAAGEERELHLVAVVKDLR
jgi:hypothetical protein